MSETVKKHPVAHLHKLNGLDPAFKLKAIKVIRTMQAKGWKLRVLWGKRTKAENDALVERGTASKTSKHLTGKAVDLINRRDPYPTAKEHPYYKDLEAACKAAAVRWGGYFKNRWDPTHFEAKN